MVHTSPVQRARAVRLPRRHRAGRVRERRARRGVARPALGRLQARDVQVRARRRVHRGARGAAQDRPRPHRHRSERAATSRCRRAMSSPRRCRTPPSSVTACTARRARGRGSRGTGTGIDGKPRCDVPAPHRRQRLVHGRVRPPGRRVADRDQPGRRLELLANGTWSGVACSARSVRRATVPRSAHRVRLPWGVMEVAGGAP